MKVTFLNEQNEVLTTLDIEDAFVSVDSFLNLPVEYAKFHATETLDIPLVIGKKFRIIDISPEGATAIPE